MQMIFSQLSEQIQSLSKLLLSLTDEQFTKNVAHLGNSSIGGHTRHIIELLQCAIEGYNAGKVDYLNRKRNLLLEGDRMLSQLMLIQLDGRVNAPDRPLQLVVDQIDDSTDLKGVSTTYYREIVYNTEHIIHHMALIKVAIIEMDLDVIGTDFGMAYSTIRYQASVRQ